MNERHACTYIGDLEKPSASGNNHARTRNAETRDRDQINRAVACRLFREKARARVN